MSNIIEILINALYEKMRNNYHDHYERIFSKFYERSYSNKYIVLLKNCEDEFILYEAIKDDSMPIRINVVTIEKDLIKTMYASCNS